MDGAGKDGAIRHVMSGVNPELCEVYSTRDAPWYAVPADDKENARLIVSAIVLDALKELKMAYPKTTAKHHAELQSIRKESAKQIGMVSISAKLPMQASSSSCSRPQDLLVGTEGYRE